MQQKTTNTMLSWIITRPALFALLSFVFLFAATVIGASIGYAFGANELFGKAIMAILLTIAFLGAITITIRKLPNTNLDRRSFVALNTAQMFITSVVFITTTLIIIMNAPSLMMRLLWLESNSSIAFLILMTLLAMFYLFLCGIYVANLYAKYRRIRTMGVSMWRTLATVPFGFCMLWIPGYLIEEPNTRKPALEIKSNWYSRITDWIIARPPHSAITLITLLLMSGFFLGFSITLFTMAAALIFVIWATIKGPDNLRKDISGRYTSIAIVLNIIAIITVVGLFVSTPNTTPKPDMYAPEFNAQINR